MEHKDTLARVAEATIDAPIELTVDIKPQNRFDAWLMRKKLLPTQKKIMLTGVTMGTLIRISRLLLDVDISFYLKENLTESNYLALSRYGETVARCVALCVHNKKSELPESLVVFITDNFTAKELLNVLTMVIKQMDVQSFMTSIVSLRGLNILENKKSEPSPES